MTVPSLSASPTTLQSSTPEELKLHPKKEPLAATYALAHRLYTGLALWIFLMPDRTNAARLASKWGGALGYALAAATCKLLHKATRAGRLSSDTYKRLNLGLLGFSLSFWALPAEAGFLQGAFMVKFWTYILAASKAFGVILSLQGWQYGVDKTGEPFVQGWPLVQEFLRGCRQTLLGLRVKDKKKALTYRNCCLLVCMGMINSLMQGLFDMRYAEAFGRSAFDITIQWSAVSRLWLIATMIYTLKEGAERDRLAGSTFVQLNWLVGSWAVGMGLAQGFRGYWIEMFAFSTPFFLKGYKSIKGYRSIKLK
jgi:hypothetical protein